jgi:predicted RNase H-like nuclease (RuvC/YqgF family)
MMSEQNKELKQALAEIEQRSNKNESQFSTQMMLAKDQEISGLSTKIAEKEAVIDKLKQEAIAKEDRLWDVEAELKVARSQFQNQANELV